MSVTISGTNVELQHGGRSIQVPCKDEKEAKAVAAEVTKVEAKMIEEEKKTGQTPEQFMTNLEKSMPPKGVGEKLDVTSKA